MPLPLLTFVFLVETGLHHVGQAGLEPLTSGDLPTLASQSAGIPGLSTAPGLFVEFLSQQRQSSAQWSIKVPHITVLLFCFLVAIVL